jgi:hypothetical protein
VATIAGSVAFGRRSCSAERELRRLHIFNELNSWEILCFVLPPHRVALMSLTAQSRSCALITGAGKAGESTSLAKTRAAWPPALPAMGGMLERGCCPGRGASRLRWAGSADAQTLSTYSQMRLRACDRTLRTPPLRKRLFSRREQAMACDREASQVLGGQSTSLIAPPPTTCQPIRSHIARNHAIS